MLIDIHFKVISNLNLYATVGILWAVSFLWSLPINLVLILQIIIIGRNHRDCLGQFILRFKIHSKATAIDILEHMNTSNDEKITTSWSSLFLFLENLMQNSSIYWGEYKLHVPLNFFI